MGRAGSGWSRTRPIHPAPFRAPLILHVIIRNALGLGFGLSISWVRETEFCGQRLAGDCRRRTRENGRNSVRRPRCAPLTDRNCESFCRLGNRGGLPGLYGGGCRDQTDGHRSLASLQNEAARRGFSARNDLSQRMSKSLAGKPKALTMEPLAKFIERGEFSLARKHQISLAFV